VGPLAAFDDLPVHNPLLLTHSAEGDSDEDVPVWTPPDWQGPRPPKLSPLTGAGLATTRASSQAWAAKPDGTDQP
jgi:hypothetical protein